MTRPTLSLRLHAGLALIALLSLAVASAACGGGRQRIGISFVGRSAHELAPLRLHRALDDATAKASRHDGFLAHVRYSPADCACPPWEAHLHGRWQRVDLRPTPSKDAQTMTEALIYLTDDRTRGASGWYFPVLDWKAPAPRHD